MATRRTGFGDDPASRGYDLTQGYRDSNPRFDKTWVKEQVAPYKDYGLPQNIADYAGKSDKQLYDMAAAAVIKMAKPNAGTPPPATPPPGTPPPATPPPAVPPTAPKPKKPKKPKVPKNPDPTPVGGNKGKIVLPDPPKLPAPKKKKKKGGSAAPTPIGGRTPPVYN